MPNIAMCFDALQTDLKQVLYPKSGPHELLTLTDVRLWMYEVRHAAVLLAASCLRRVCASICVYLWMCVVFVMCVCLCVFPLALSCVVCPLFYSWLVSREAPSSGSCYLS
jgi:hypothetical protein